MVIYRQSSYPLQQGFMIIEAIVVTCVLMSLMSLGARYTTKQAEHTVNEVTARQLQQVTQAAQYYVQDHYQEFKNSPKLTLEWPLLVEAGYLSDRQLRENHYGQAYQFNVTQEKGLLQLLLTTQGGHPINEQSLRQIAALAGSSAGYTTVLDNGKIVGNQKGWILEGVTLQPGHLASLTLVNENEVMDAATFLRRKSIAGHPEYNTMQADLEIDGHLLKLSDNFAKTTLSATTLTLQNSTSKDNAKVITIDVQGTPMLRLRDTYNLFGGVTSLLSGTRLEFIRDSDGNEIKLDNRDPSINIKNSKSEMELRPDGLFIDDKKVVPEQKIYHVDDINNPYDLQSIADQLDCDHNEGKLFLVGDSSSSLRKKLLVCIWRSNTNEHGFLAVAEGRPPKFGNISADPTIHHVNSVTDPYDLQRIADHLDCNHNEGKLFLVGDSSSSLRKRLLVCIWRDNTDEHSFLVVADGHPPRFGSID